MHSLTFVKSSAKAGKILQTKNNTAKIPIIDLILIYTPFLNFCGKIVPYRPPRSVSAVLQDYFTKLILFEIQVNKLFALFQSFKHELRDNVEQEIKFKSFDFQSLNIPAGFEPASLS